jgi:hypothetical protein
VGQYVGMNIQALRSFYNPTRGDIHHKWPLFLGGPDNMTNFVFLTFAEHRAWHSALYAQGVNPRPPYGRKYCIVN